MAEQTTAAPTAERTADKKKWWCNFCNFTTDDQQEYLSHSCQEVLARGDRPAPPKQTCG